MPRMVEEVMIELDSKGGFRTYLGLRKVNSDRRNSKCQGPGAEGSIFHFHLKLTRTWEVP